ncbi:MAG: plasma-membrane proton-efflux P-type ATPase [Dehalococcoidia bacterium]|nr:plasma-membrane proton-efflux P-type ATPase [Dehalococcoidia bacterium]
MDSESLRTASLESVKQSLGFSSAGLSQNEAESRLSEYGHNELAQKKRNPLLRLLSYFKGPIPTMILIAAGLSAVLQHWPDLAVILTLLVMNALIGFREESQADDAIEALKAKLALNARVRRDGQWQTVAARQLVPGDIVRVRIGEVVPADIRLLDEDTMEVDQAALTGESLPVERRQGDAVYSGSVIKQGEGDALVYATGAVSFYGRTAQLVESAVTRSHLQRAVLKLADYLIVIAMVLGVLIIGAGLRRGDNVLDVVQFVLVLTIAAVPVAMPAVMSVTMALGARVLAAKQAIVTKLPAIEEIAGIDVLCTDKTGTLTQGSLTPGDPFAVEGVSTDEVQLAAALASREEDNDSIDIAVLQGMRDIQVLSTYEVVHFKPFDPVHKRTEARVKDSNGHEYSVSKGAPQIILALDRDAASKSDEVQKMIAEFASRGFRSLGVARTDAAGTWRFLGIIPLFDPLREDTRKTIDAAREMGLKIKMVTGDQVAIAREIARQLELGTNILDASVFEETKAHQVSRLAESIENADGFAQVFPEHKYHIVETLQQKGHIVGMTGDGVNDAPALKKADAGIAVSGATDAARAAASIVLLTPGLSAIVDAIRESRRIFRRMTNYAIYRVAETVALLGFISMAVLLYDMHPITAIMVVLLAIMNDGAMLSIAYDNVLHDKGPEVWQMRTVLGVATAIGLFAAARTFVVMHIGQTVFNLDSATLQTLVYLNLSVGGHLTLFVARTRGPFWSVRPSPILLGAVVGTQILATLIAVSGLLMDPLSWKLAGFVWAFSLGQFFLQDLVKLGAYRVLRSAHTGLLAARS